MSSILELPSAKVAREKSDERQDYNVQCVKYINDAINHGRKSIYCNFSTPVDEKFLQILRQKGYTVNVTKTDEEPPAYNYYNYTISW
jgi:hypothetical protein